MQDQDLIEFRCSKCNKRVRAKPKYAGRSTNCPGCGELLRVPDALPEQADSGTAQEESTPDDSRSLVVVSKTEIAVGTLMEDTPDDSASRTPHIDGTSPRLSIHEQIERAAFRPEDFNKNELFWPESPSRNDRGLVMMIFVCVVSSASFVLMALEYLVDTINPNQRRFVYPAVCSLVLMSIGVGCVALLYRLRLGEAVSRTVRIAAERTFLATRAGRQHLDTVEALPNLLDVADDRISNANREFESNAFGPFWDEIEGAVRALAAFRSNVEEAHSKYNEYERLLTDGSHTFPSLPRDYVGDVPDPLPTLRRFAEVVRLGQTNFQFATIWEHRKTREAVVTGFQTWADALAQIQISVIGAVRISRLG